LEEHDKIEKNQAKEVVKKKGAFSGLTGLLFKNKKKNI
jgi:hypothetical protein